MTRALLFLLLTACAFGLVAWTAFHRELWEPALAAQGIERDSQSFRILVKVFVVAVVGVPLTGLIHAICMLGSNRGATDIHGYTVLRPRMGTRCFLIVAALGLAALFFAYPMVDPETQAPWAFQAGGVAFLLCGLVAVTGKVRYDGRTVGTFNMIRGWRQHDWADLAEIRDMPQVKEFVLLFRNGRKASISYRYAGIDDLLDTARAKLDSHAGTPRGRNRKARA
jgi:hypothetical protein